MTKTHITHASLYLAYACAIITAQQPIHPHQRPSKRSTKRIQQAAKKAFPKKSKLTFSKEKSDQSRIQNRRWNQSKEKSGQVTKPRKERITLNLSKQAEKTLVPQKEERCYPHIKMSFKNFCQEPSQKEMINQIRYQQNKNQKSAKCNSRKKGIETEYFFNRDEVTSNLGNAKNLNNQLKRKIRRDQEREKKPSLYTGRRKGIKNNIIAQQNHRNWMRFNQQHEKVEQQARSRERERKLGIKEMVQTSHIF